MYENTNVQNLVIFENHYLCTDAVREFDPDAILLHHE